MGLTEKPEERDNIVDINLDGIQRTRFRINGDPTAIIELNLSDLQIHDRLIEGTNQLQAAISEIAELPDEDEHLSEKLKQIDGKMREYVDYIFNYPVSSVCARYGTMYDLKDGKFAYERIIDGLTKLYSDNLREEFKKLDARIKKHTDKYTAPAKGRKKR